MLCCLKSCRHKSRTSHLCATVGGVEYKEQRKKKWRRRNLLRKRRKERGHMDKLFAQTKVDWERDNVDKKEIERGKKKQERRVNIRQ